MLAALRQAAIGGHEREQTAVLQATRELLGDTPEAVDLTASWLVATGWRAFDGFKQAVDYVATSGSPRATAYLFLIQRPSDFEIGKRLETLTEAAKAEARAQIVEMAFRPPADLYSELRVAALNALAGAESLPALGDLLGLAADPKASDPLRQAALGAWRRACEEAKKNSATVTPPADAAGRLLALAVSADGAEGVRVAALQAFAAVARLGPTPALAASSDQLLALASNAAAKVPLRAEAVKAYLVVTEQLGNVARVCDPLWDLATTNDTPADLESTILAVLPAQYAAARPYVVREAMLDEKRTIGARLALLDAALRWQVRGAGSWADTMLRSLPATHSDARMQLLQLIAKYRVAEAERTVRGIFADPKSPARERGAASEMLSAGAGTATPPADEEAALSAIGPRLYAIAVRVMGGSPVSGEISALALQYGRVEMAEVGLGDIYPTIAEALNSPHRSIREWGLSMSAAFGGFAGPSPCARLGRNVGGQYMPDPSEGPDTEYLLPDYLVVAGAPVPKGQVIQQPGGASIVLRRGDLQNYAAANAAALSSSATQAVKAAVRDANWEKALFLATYYNPNAPPAVPLTVDALSTLAELGWMDTRQPVSMVAARLLGKPRASSRSVSAACSLQGVGRDRLVPA